MDGEQGLADRILRCQEASSGRERCLQYGGEAESQMSGVGMIGVSGNLDMV